MKKIFTAFEYHKDEKFYPAKYEYSGSLEAGWDIYRNELHYLTLPKGYELLKTLTCGICSTDISRHHLPFPLPQITGHEVVALYKNKMVAVDINAAHKHLGDHVDCTYCNNGLENHCPDRLTLGIDRLPGGFAPYILVPQYAIIPLPEKFNLKCASIIEPFAAALHAVKTENIGEGDRVAVVGPRRLGALLILALKLWREKKKINFDITAIIKTDATEKLCLLAGADQVVNVSCVTQKTYDVVFDTSGAVSGFEMALSIAKRSVHVKSTNGKSALGLDYLTEMVIDELCLLALTASELNEYLLNFQPENILIDEQLDAQVIKTIKSNHVCNVNDIAMVAVGRSIDFINNAVRGIAGKSLVKPKSTLILVMDKVNEDTESPLINSLKRGVKINTSRCGNFKSAINVLQCNQVKVNGFLNEFISEIYSVDLLPEAFKKAKTDKAAIKVLVEHVEHG